MDKLGLIIWREYLAKVRNKSFIIMTILSPLLIVGMIILIAYLTKINDSESKIIAVLNQSAFFEDKFQPGKAISYVLFEEMDLEAAKDSVKALQYDGLLFIPNAANVDIVAQNMFFYSEDNPNTSTTSAMESIIQGVLREQRMENLGVSNATFQKIEKEFNLKLASFDGGVNLKGVNEMKAFIGGAFGYAIMMFIIIYGGFVMRSVIEEKTSRIIEVIISSVKPFYLMLGKIIGTSLAGITQFGIWMISSGALLFVCVLLSGINPETLYVSPEMAGAEMAQLPSDLDENFIAYAQEALQIPWALLLLSFVVYFVLGYLIYSSIYAAIGAAVDNETDTQQFIFPIILPLMLGIYIGFFSVFGNPHGPIAVGFSLFPLTSPIVMLMRLPGGIGEGGVPVWQLLLSLILLIMTFLAIVWLASKIYRVGILMYGKKPTYRELYKWLKY